jgi:lipopolysaccharide biosynthesis protein
MLREDKVLVVPFQGAGPAQPRRIAIVLHIYFVEIADMLRSACNNVVQDADILITTDSETKAANIRKTFGDWSRGQVVITVIPNRGRDMPSKFQVYRDRLAEYDLILFLHSKRSEHLDEGCHNWGETLTGTLAGSTAVVESILRLFDDCPDLGIVFPDHFDKIRIFLGWGENRRAADRLATRMGIDLGTARALEFGSGSMFWARPAALRPILDLGLTIDDYAEEASQIDGTLAHALERLTAYSSEAAGYRWLKIVRADLYADRGNRIAVDGNCVGAAVATASTQLLPPARRTLRKTL